jgi:hypothetical protein
MAATARPMKNPFFEDFDEATAVVLFFPTVLRFCAIRVGGWEGIP